MLERATACLDTGARLSVRCARRTSRSNRSLGPQFWNHGAGDPELSLWINSQPSQAPLDVHGNRRQPRTSSETTTDRATNATPTDVPFLDFLYPPQALALLHRGGTPRVEKWERRNERRLPKGFVHATRGYASKAGREPSRTETFTEGSEEANATDAFSNQPKQAHSVAYQEWDAIPPTNTDANVELPDKNTTTDRDELTSVSPAKLAGLPSSAKGLRTLMAAYEPHKSLEYTELAWALYEKLEERDRENVKSRFLGWLAENDNEVAETHCLELYHSIPATHRTMAVYKAALTTFVRSRLFGLAEQGHAEALDRLSNGHELSTWLCSTAIEHGMWDLASRVKDQLYAKHERTAKAWVEQIFWREISEMPDLLPKAIGLSKHYRMLSQAGSISPEFREFSHGMFKRAIIQEYTTPHAGNSLTVSKAKKTLRDGQIRYLIGRIQLTSADSPEFFREVLKALTDSTSLVQYHDAHKTVSYMYRQYRTMSGVVPSQALLQSILHRLLEYAERAARVTEYSTSLSPSILRDDWIKFHKKMGIQAYLSITRYFARTGDIEGLKAYHELLCEDHPRYEDQEPVLWVLVYAFARRGELLPAVSAFERIYSFAAEAGKTPPLQVWNTLMHAYSRAGDLEGALAFMRRIVDSGLKPDTYSFHPLLELYAARGDVDAVQVLHEQYDTLADAPRRTELYGSLMTAHVNANDIREARNVLSDVVEKVDSNEVEGSLTGCFNIFLTALALAREQNETMRVYRWMKSNQVEPDEFTYSALMQGLVAHRATDSAWKILKTVMPENGLQPRAFHYAVVMTGFVRERAYDSALAIHKQMQRKNIRPSLSTDAIYAKAKALRETRPSPRQNGEIIDYPVDMIIEEIQEIFHDPAAGLAAKEPQFYSVIEHSSPQALLFSQLINTYGSAKLLTAVQVLMQRYAQAENKGDDYSLELMPVRILTSLMPAYIQAESWDEVQLCWDLAKAQTNAITARNPAPYITTQDAQREKPANLLKLSVAATTTVDQVTPPGETPKTVKDTTVPDHSGIAPAFRSLLTSPLRHYITALAFQSRFADMISAVTTVLKEGYVMDRQTWNVFIEHLLRPSPPLALLAFRLTEKYLMPAFPGWMSGKPVVNFSQKVQGLNYMRARYLRPNELMPRYNTLVMLGAALLDLRRRDALGNRKTKFGDSGLDRYVGTLKQIRLSAPRTLHAVQSMPNVEMDHIQDRLLRRQT